ncbi:MAG: ribose-5-phosphate isomerase RpiA [Parachlamydia sp.]|jgi:ribose 5-phosphate isomerase A|nr:ribose-5-phosphate isomerase RpiA [Parachlamydia sp.]
MMAEIENSLNKAKKAAGEAAAAFVQEGMVVGLGTGSTAKFFIEAIGKRCQEGLKIKAIATSHQTTRDAENAKIPLADANEIKWIDLTVDGADEIDTDNNMIKGGGGALLREKLLALASREFVVIIDESKLVKNLGKFHVPVEIAPFAFPTTIERLNNHGYYGALRCNPDKSIFLTDNAHYIYDIQFANPILDPKREHKKLKEISGVIETGFFFDIATRVIIGYKEGSIKIKDE